MADDEKTVDFPGWQFLPTWTADGGDHWVAHKFGPFGCVFSLSGSSFEDVVAKVREREDYHASNPHLAQAAADNRVVRIVSRP